MVILAQTISLKNSCDLIKKSKDVFSPVKEAVTNAFDAISQRQAIGENFAPAISIAMHFRTEKNLFKEKSGTLDFIAIEDNGIGFTSENLSRFKELGEKAKGLNNRGTGKIQIFHHFNQISIDSTFVERNKWARLTAEWELLNGEYDDLFVETEAQADRKTIVKISKPYDGVDERDFYVRYLENVNELKIDVLKRFLLRIWIGNRSKTLNFIVKTYLDNIEQASFSFNGNNIPKPDKEERVSINTKQAKISGDKRDKKKFHVEWSATEQKNELVIQRFKLPISEMDENGVYMCSKGIVVESFKFPAIRRKDANYAGFRYIACITGAILDDSNNVSQSVDNFTFPSKMDVEADLENRGMYLFNQSNEFVLRDEIDEKLGHGLSKLYDDVDGLKKEREKNINEIAWQYGIPQEDVEASNIAFNDAEEKVTEKLFESQAKRFARQSIEIRKTYEELKKLESKDLDPTSDQYRVKFGELSNKLLEKIPQQNKDELARYVIRRDMVVNLLRLILDNDLAIQKEWAKKKSNGEKIRQSAESLIHDLIFKRRMTGVPNDLWILNEEFVHFEGCSELELNKLELGGEKLLRPDVDIDSALKSVGIEKGSSLEWRPDIFLYPEEGKCILVEFKAPNVEVSIHCDQIQRYAKMIANYSVRKITQFYGFLIGEQINQLMVPDRYKRVPYGNYWMYPSEPVNNVTTGLPVADIYQEIVPLSEIAKRAKIRNRSFAQKLGISAEDIKKAQEAEGNEDEK